MRKPTKHNKQFITFLMLKTAQEYISTFVSTNDDDSLRMYADDVIYNTKALETFLANSNAQQLHDSIMQQDTLVREYYIATLRYIEEKNLIARERFCVVQYMD